MGDNQISTQGQHDRLRPTPEGLGNRSDNAAFVAGLRLQHQNATLTHRPARHQGVQHPHGLNHLGITQALGGLQVGDDTLLVRFTQGLAGVAVVQSCQPHQHDCTSYGHPAKPGMEQKHHRGIDRQPRRVEKRKQAIAGQELTQGRQIIE
ncbi:hypothetical protein D3C76_1287470 [compost metagenome]